MQLFAREQKFDAEKGESIPGAYFFGHFDADPLPPFSVSFATFEHDYVAEKPHYHTRRQKVYIILEGKGILMVDGQSVTMEPEHMIHIAPGEVHYVQKILQAPLRFVVVTSAKDNDKVTLQDPA